MGRLMRKKKKKTKGKKFVKDELVSIVPDTDKRYNMGGPASKSFWEEPEKKVEEPGTGEVIHTHMSNPCAEVNINETRPVGEKLELHTFGEPTTYIDTEGIKHGVFGADPDTAEIDGGSNIHIGEVDDNKWITYDNEDMTLKWTGKWDDEPEEIKEKTVDQMTERISKDLAFATKYGMKGTTKDEMVAKFSDIINETLESITNEPDDVAFDEELEDALEEAANETTMVPEPKPHNYFRSGQHIHMAIDDMPEEVDPVDEDREFYLTHQFSVSPNDHGEPSNASINFLAEIADYLGYNATELLAEAHDMSVEEAYDTEFKQASIIMGIDYGRYVVRNGGGPAKVSDTARGRCKSIW